MERRKDKTRREKEKGTKRGKVGHKAVECESRQVGAVDEEEYEGDENEDEHVQAATLWNAGAAHTEVGVAGPMELDREGWQKVTNEKKAKKVEITSDSGAWASRWPEACGGTPRWTPRPRG